VEDRPYEHENICRQDDPQKGFLQVVIENVDMPHRYSGLKRAIPISRGGSTPELGLVRALVHQMQ